MCNGEENSSGRSSNPYPVIERRYRTSKYFLEDQLRCSEAIQDFRTVKNLLAQTPQFNLRGTFKFATVNITVSDSTDQ
jgi:hypothetical protein